MIDVMVRNISTVLQPWERYELIHNTVMGMTKCVKREILDGFGTSQIL